MRKFNKAHQNWKLSVTFPLSTFKLIINSLSFIKGFLPIYGFIIISDAIRKASTINTKITPTKCNLFFTWICSSFSSISTSNPCPLSRALLLLNSDTFYYLSDKNETMPGRAKFIRFSLVSHMREGERKTREKKVADNNRKCLSASATATAAHQSAISVFARSMNREYFILNFIQFFFLMQHSLLPFCECWRWLLLPNKSPNSQNRIRRRFFQHSTSLSRFSNHLIYFITPGVKSEKNGSELRYWKKSVESAFVSLVDSDIS